MTTAIQTTTLGNKDELTAYANRIRYMVKGGAKLQDGEAMALAQVAMVTGLNPFIGEVWYIPGSGPMIGIAGARKLDNQQVAERGGYTWEENVPVDPAEAGASPDQIANVAAAFRCDVHDSAATAQYQALLTSTLAALRDAGSKDPFGEAKEICGPRPVWSGYGFALRNESSRMSKVQLARKRAHADALKRRIVTPFGAGIAEVDAAPGYDVDAEEVDMIYPAERSELQNLSELGFDSPTENAPIQQQTKAMPRQSKRETEKPAGPVGILIDLGVDNTSHAARIATLLKLSSSMTAEKIEALYKNYRALRDEGHDEQTAASMVLS